VYDGNGTQDGKYDVALLSYSLSMMHPHESDVIRNVYNDLRPGGFIALVDFESTRWSTFRTVMKANHVRMDGFLMPLLEESFMTVVQERRTAFGGWWDYLVYIGQKEQ
jgi:S-adenosylmethionine-diacylgycerolhomoserine-N-methlytransferase